MNPLWTRANGDVNDDGPYVIDVRPVRIISENVNSKCRDNGTNIEND